MKLPRAEMKKARIEIIPMIDAIFFLLVFFMMTSLSMVQLNSQKVNLPQSASQAVQLQGPKIVVSVTREGELFLDRERIEEKQLLSLLAPRVQAQPQTVVILNVDRDQQMARFSRVFDLVKQANPASVMIAATPRDPATLPAK